VLGMRGPCRGSSACAQQRRALQGLRRLAKLGLHLFSSLADDQSIFSLSHSLIFLNVYSDRCCYVAPIVG